MKRMIFSGTAFVFLMCATSLADAGLIQLSAPTDLQASDTTLSYPDADGSMYSNTVSYAVGGTTVSLSTTNNTLTRYLVGTDYFFSAFPDGTPILYYGDNFGANDPLTLSFSTGVNEVGLNLDEAIFGDYTVTFTAYDGINALGTFISNGNDPSALSFVGLAATGGDLITSLLISDNQGNDLAISPVTFGVATVPEPASFSLLGIGLAGLAGDWARRRTAV